MEFTSATHIDDICYVLEQSSLARYVGKDFNPDGFCTNAAVLPYQEAWKMLAETVLADRK